MYYATVKTDSGNERGENRESFEQAREDAELLAVMYSIENKNLKAHAGVYSADAVAVGTLPKVLYRFTAECGKVTRRGEAR